MSARGIIASRYNSTLDAVAWSLRSLIEADAGAELIAADYSNIEGRALAWLAGEDWKLDAFRAYDAGAGPDLYKLAYAKSFGVPVDLVTKDMRQLGKVQELALGYQGAHGAFLSMVKNYAIVPWLRADGPAPAGIQLHAIASAVREAVTPKAWDAATEQYWQGARETADEILAQRLLDAMRDIWEGNTEGEAIPDIEDLTAEAAKTNRHQLPPEQWAALRIVVDGWRQAHPATVMFWRAAENAAIASVEQPGTVFAAGERIRYCATGDILRCKLPSGRTLAYPYPRVVETKNKFNPSRPARKLEFEGVDSKTKKWQKQKIYGGLLAENCCQSVSRDLLADALIRLDARDYAPVLHVYDEIVCETKIETNNLTEMMAIMNASEPWADGLPVAVSGWQGKRYRK